MIISRKIIFICSFIIIFVVVPIVFFIQRTNQIEERKQERIISIFPENEALNKWINNLLQRLSYRDKYSNIKNAELVNLIHVQKASSGFSISCYFGPAYNLSNLDKLYPNEMVSRGRIQECNEETAKLIDSIIKNSQRDCRIPLNRPFPIYVNNYYLITLAWNKNQISQSIAQSMIKEDECYKPLLDLIDQELMTNTFISVFDIEAKVFYR